MLSKLIRPRSVRRLFAESSRACICSLNAGSERFFATVSQAEKHEFKAETRKLLNIVAKSLYTDKEVFIRELISNASDALEKLRYLDSTHQIVSRNDAELPLGIRVEVDEANRRLTISDSGIGMTREELIANLGTIARSGSKEFVAQNGGGESDSKIIGQFGVGFYSCFVTSDRVEVFSKAADASKDTQGYRWVSDGAGEFTIEPFEGVTRGTKIVLHLKEDAAEFCSMATVKAAASKFSSFVDFPLVLAVAEKPDEVTTVNNQEALWLRTDASSSEHTEFFRFLAGTSYGDPLYTLSFHTDAPLSIKSVFYVPEDAPDRWFQQSPKVGVSLHSRRVLVKKHADEIIPSWLHWVKGVVDCDDMPLNISRENMQDTSLLKKLSTAVVRRILRFLADEAKRDSAKFAGFWRKFGFYLKAGLLEDQQHNQGAHKDNIIKLLRFSSTGGDEIVSLAEISEKLRADQKNIYYVTAPDRKTALASPYLEGMNGRPVLVLSEDIDEFVVNYIGSFKDRKLVSVAGEDVENFAEKAADVIEGLSEAEKTIVTTLVKSVLADKTNSVKFTDKLKASPALVTSAISPHMRKMMKNMMKDSGQSSSDALDGIPVSFELNPHHPVVKKLAAIADNQPELAKVATRQLFDNACISAGMVEDPRLLLGNLNSLLEFCLFHGASNECKIPETPEEVQKDT